MKLQHFFKIIFPGTQTAGSKGVFNLISSEQKKESENQSSKKRKSQK